MIKRNVIKKRNCVTCRSARTKLYLKGEKCYTNCVIDKNTKTLGLVPSKEFGKLMQNKHNILTIYGITSTALKTLMIKYIYSKKYEHLFSVLEMRLDSLVFRAGIAKSMQHARQLVNHEKISVMSGKSDVFPSLLLNINQTFAFRGEDCLFTNKNCDWIEFDAATKEFKLIALPTANNYLFDNQLIKDYYKKH